MLKTRRSRTIFVLALSMMVLGIIAGVVSQSWTWFVSAAMWTLALYGLIYIAFTLERWVSGGE
jgi:hypothetical protein